MDDVGEHKGERPQDAPKRGMHLKHDVQANGVGHPSPALSSTPDQHPLPPGCPPAAAIDGPIFLFRVSETKKPAPSDCLTAYEKGTHLNLDPCRRRSLSSYTDRQDAERLRRRVRHFNDHQICEGTVPAGAGVHLATPGANEKSHWSWWPTKAITRHSFFTVTP